LKPPYQSVKPDWVAVSYHRPSTALSRNWPCITTGSPDCALCGEPPVDVLEPAPPPQAVRAAMEEDNKRVLKAGKRRSILLLLILLVATQKQQLPSCWEWSGCHDCCKSSG